MVKDESIVDGRTGTVRQNVRVLMNIRIDGAR